MRKKFFNKLHGLIRKLGPLDILMTLTLVGIIVTAIIGFVLDIFHRP